MDNDARALLRKTVAIMRDAEANVWLCAETRQHNKRGADRLERALDRTEGGGDA